LKHYITKEYYDKSIKGFRKRTYKIPDRNIGNIDLTDGVKRFCLYDEEKESGKYVIKNETPKIYVGRRVSIDELERMTCISLNIFRQKKIEFFCLFSDLEFFPLKENDITLDEYNEELSLIGKNKNR